MLQALLHTHWILAVIVMLLLIVSLLRFAQASWSKSAFAAADNRLSQITVSLAHLQMLAGLILFFVSNMGFKAYTNPNIDVMGDAGIRLYALEHPLVNILAVVLITIGRSRVKKLDTDAKKFSNLMLFFGLGLVLLASRMPWDRLFQLPG